MGRAEDARMNAGVQLGDKLADMSRWPCMNPRCGNKVDPDAADQYCSVTCRNAVISGKSPSASRMMMHMHRIQAQAGWIQQAKAAGLINTVSPPPPTTQSPTAAISTSFLRANPRARERKMAEFQATQVRTFNIPLR